MWKLKIRYNLFTTNKILNHWSDYNEFNDYINDNTLKDDGNDYFMSKIEEKTEWVEIETSKIKWIYIHQKS